MQVIGDHLHQDVFASELCAELNQSDKINQLTTIFNAFIPRRKKSNDSGFSNRWIGEAPFQMLIRRFVLISFDESLVRCLFNPLCLALCALTKLLRKMRRNTEISRNMIVPLVLL
ncbi:hypothetical protein KOR42_22700 [Thalassoglobus neptunius]|uniref:Uncharacterized protein n=1 Tax=Thalassoglobus neptunius TaxID=1938619 RepID=A0A5C5X996_9PLAN|nr:hypothetical protein KOR42_22700 [Thalassoglobus neptunius]